VARAAKWALTLACCRADDPASLMVDLSSATGDPIFTASVLAQGCVLTHHAQEANFIIIGIALLSPSSTQAISAQALTQHVSDCVFHISGAKQGGADVFGCSALTQRLLPSPRS
jgi:hypothetical protein